MRSLHVYVAAGLVTLGAPLAARAAEGWNLHPDGFGTKSYAAWKAREGEPDDTGNAAHALYFQKLVPTAVPAAAVAVFDVPPGTTIADITPLAFDWRVDGHCGSGAPRFNLQYKNAGDDTVHTAFVGGCANMAPSPGAEPGWMRATTAVPGGAVFPVGGPPPTADALVVGLSIVFDEGTDTPPNGGRAWLDRIQVGSHFWNGPSDNGAPGPEGRRPGGRARRRPPGRRPAPHGVNQRAGAGQAPASRSSRTTSRTRTPETGAGGVRRAGCPSRLLARPERSCVTPALVRLRSPARARM
jgi:hypothetical protein